MPATVLAERVGWTGSITWFRENVKRLRPEHRPIDPADRLIVGARGRGAVRSVVPAAEDPARGRHDQAAAGAGDHRRALAVHDRPDDPDPEDRGPAAGLVGADPAAGAGAAPADLGQRARHRPRASAAPRAWRRSWAPWPPSWCCCRRGTRSPRGSWSAATAGSRPRSCPAGRSPRRRTSTPSSPTGWPRANARVVRTIKAAPVDLLDADRAAMLPLPPIPLHLGWRNRIRLGRDYYVRLDTNDYSVDPTVIGRMVDVAADLERVRVRAGGPDRRRTPAGLGPRNHRHRPGPRRDRRAAAQAVPAAPRRRAAGDDLARDLGDYDRAFGLAPARGSADGRDQDHADERSSRSPTSPAR